MGHWQNAEDIIHYQPRYATLWCQVRVMIEIMKASPSSCRILTGCLEREKDGRLSSVTASVCSRINLLTAGVDDENIGWKNMKGLAVDCLG